MGVKPGLSYIPNRHTLNFRYKIVYYSLPSRELYNVESENLEKERERERFSRPYRDFKINRKFGSMNV